MKTFWWRNCSLKPGRTLQSTETPHHRGQANTGHLLAAGLRVRGTSGTSTSPATRPVPWTAAWTASADWDSGTTFYSSRSYGQSSKILLCKYRKVPCRWRRMSSSFINSSERSLPLVRPSLSIPLWVWWSYQCLECPHRSVGIPLSGLL